MNAKTLSVFLIAAVLYLGVLWLREAGDHNLRVHVFDVGQGDAILIEMPDDTTILIDGGPGNYILSQLSEVLPPWKRSIDYLILTHPHADHISGLLDVLERYDVDHVFYYHVCYQNSEYMYFLSLLNDMGVGNGNIDGALFRCGGGGVDLRLSKYINRSGECIEIDNINNASVMTLLEVGDFTMLLSGDAETEREEEFLRSAIASRVSTVDVIKAGHHCSRTASSETYLRRFRPTLAICSCGVDNDFDHPHQEALERFDLYDISSLRTDLNGSITLVSDGSTWWVECEETAAEK